MSKHITSILFAVAIITAAALLGNAYVKRSKPVKSITVTGLGKMDFSSDLVVWEGHFSREARDLQLAAEKLNTDRTRIAKYLKEHGIHDSEMVFTAVVISERTQSKYGNDGRYMGEEFEGYQLLQQVQITSKKLEAVAALSREITDLINEGIRFYSAEPRYYYTQLSDLKIALISDATADARARAEQIAENSGSSLGGLVQANMGIFQITGLYSNEEFSWGGTFNTSSRQKSASITMKLTYDIK
jgi:uncharacterized protein